MNCEQMRAMLDAYIDGELSEEEARALRAHADTCEDCKRELAAAELLRDALGHMDDDLTVPLEAQAAWRRAVRREAGKGRRRGALRWAYAAAAVLVLAIGCTTVLKGDVLGRRNALPEAPNQIVASSGDERRLIAADGDAGAQMARSTGAQQDYTAWKKYAVADFDRACDTIEALSTEYSGEASSDRAEGGEVLGAREAMYCVELPCEYMQDFLNAASMLGEELDSEVRDHADGTAIVYIQIFEQNAE